MNNVLMITSPVQQTMSHSDRTHVENMAIYAEEKAKFKASKSRQCAAWTGGCSGVVGTLGCLVASPIVRAKVGGALALGITVAASVACCIAACVSMKIADIPTAPTHPDEVPPQHD